MSHPRIFPSRVHLPLQVSNTSAAAISAITHAVKLAISHPPEPPSPRPRAADYGSPSCHARREHDVFVRFGIQYSVSKVLRIANAPWDGSDRRKADSAETITWPNGINLTTAVAPSPLSNEQWHHVRSRLSLRSYASERETSSRLFPPSSMRQAQEPRPRTPRLVTMDRLDGLVCGYRCKKVSVPPVSTPASLPLVQC